jgi:hypothetical protein
MSSQMLFYFSPLITTPLWSSPVSLNTTLDRLRELLVPDHLRTMQLVWHHSIQLSL